MVDKNASLAHAPRSPIAITLSLLASLGSLLGMLVALLIAGFTCDESCDDRSSRWQDDPGAWQWDGQLVLGAAATLLSFYALWAAITRRRSAPALALSAAVWVAWLLWNGIFV